MGLKLISSAQPALPNSRFVHPTPCLMPQTGHALNPVPGLSPKPGSNHGLPHLRAVHPLSFSIQMASSHLALTRQSPWAMTSQSGEHLCASQRALTADLCYD